MARIGILVVAYNAASTLHTVLDRIPPEFRSQIDQVLISDDASDDATYLVGLGYQQTNDDIPITVIRHPSNLGYGGNQKVGYQWAIDHDLDIVVLLHGDGQYAPELLPEMVAPLERGEADAVFGSRMIDSGAARRGGMPLYKYAGNRILTTFENRVTGTTLSEWHSGYRAYSVDALRQIPFHANSDGFDFDTNVIVQLIEARLTIAEIPIPTYYGDEISHVSGLRYAFDVSRHVVQYRLQKMGFGSGELAFASCSYDEKVEDGSSHGLILDAMRSRTPRRVLDLGCNDGNLAQRIRASGHSVIGVDLEEHPQVRSRVDDFFKADLEQGLPSEVGSDYDIVIAADVFEHLREPGRLLREIHGVLDANGSIITSVPNVAHWYPRVRFVSGRFDYDRRGILDQDHVRFFTRRTFTALAEKSGYRVVRCVPTGLPFEVAERGVDDAQPTAARRILRGADQVSLMAWPNLFAYQWIFELQPI